MIVNGIFLALQTLKLKSKNWKTKKETKYVRIDSQSKNGFSTYEVFQSISLIKVFIEHIFTSELFVPHIWNILQVKLIEAEEKITSLSQELESIKSDLKSSSDKMSFEQKRFGTMNESLKEQLDNAMEKIDQVKTYKVFEVLM